MKIKPMFQLECEGCHCLRYVGMETFPKEFPHHDEAACIKEAAETRAMKEAWDLCRIKKRQALIAAAALSPALQAIVGTPADLVLLWKYRDTNEITGGSSCMTEELYADCIKAAKAAKAAK